MLETLGEAVQVCEELQESVSGLDGRLAELIHWETEVREFYDLLKEKSHRHQRGQDSRTRVVIMISHFLCCFVFFPHRHHLCFIWKLSE